ncbi:conserved protein of unknown function [Cupriavidus taiwanensis]|uniref:Uncharacterized protein n=1 Tax=Cupriavidus taiwanensis TaxID=164546 RepID=A0A9Q7UQX7_9BURK|nr:hypothetical protein [Cupriavidus taiwanensis]SPD63010.1 conserved protein of unknown function [Cupriavidus taiwanensis]
MIPWTIKQLEYMTADEERKFWRDFEQSLRNDSGDAARAHLKMGNPIYYSDVELPASIVREWPNGKREIVTIDTSGYVKVIKSL